MRDEQKQTPQDVRREARQGEEKARRWRFYCILNYRYRWKFRLVISGGPLGHLLVNFSTTKTSQSQRNLFFTAAATFAARGEQTWSLNCTPVSKWKLMSSRKPIAFVEPELYSRSKYILFLHHKVRFSLSLQNVFPSSWTI